MPPGEGVAVATAPRDDDDAADTDDDDATEDDASEMSGGAG